MKTDIKPNNKTNNKSLEKVWQSFPWQTLSGPVVGVDEAGRGCLAGRVYAAAVHIPDGVDYSDFKDSKLLSEAKRNQLSTYILEKCVYGIAYASVSEIESLNILNASLLAMQRAVEALGFEQGHILVDGNKTIPSLASFEQTALIKGDLRAAPIAAASILAKVARDAYIFDLSRDYPQYGFEQHKAYATKDHKKAIERWGPSPEHRKTFAGVKDFL